MNASPNEGLSLYCEDQTDWQILRARRHNVLIQGPVSATNAVVGLLQPYLGERQMRKPPQSALEFPSGEPTSLILEDVAALSAEDQSRLFMWLNGGGERTQIVSTTERSLFALVTRGLFNQELYYRLNVVLLRVGLRDVTGRRAMRKRRDTPRG